MLGTAAQPSRREDYGGGTRTTKLDANGRVTHYGDVVRLPSGCGSFCSLLFVLARAVPIEESARQPQESADD